ncbi:MAG: hypothetical protein DRI48_07235, partial [Chloroflexi bacterium]
VPEGEFGKASYHRYATAIFDAIADPETGSRSVLYPNAFALATKVDTRLQALQNNPPIRGSFRSLEIAAPDRPRVITGAARFDRLWCLRYNGKAVYQLPVSDDADDALTNC